MYTRQQLNSYTKVGLKDLLDKEFTRDELRQASRDNKINCVPTKMSKADIIDVLVSCREGKLSCQNQYVKIPDEFKGEVGCKNVGEVEINIVKKEKKKKVIRDSSSDSPKKEKKSLEDIEKIVRSILDVDVNIKTSSDLKNLLLSKGLSKKDFDANKGDIIIMAKKYIKEKKDRPKVKLNLEDIVKNSILSYRKDIKNISKSEHLKKLLLKKKNLTEEEFYLNKKEIKRLARIYIIQKIKKEEEEEEEEDEEEEEEEDEEEEEEEEEEDELEKSVKKFIMSFDGKLSDITVNLVKKSLIEKFTDDQLNKKIIRKFIIKYGNELKKTKKKKSVSPRARSSKEIEDRLRAGLAVSSRVSPVVPPRVSPVVPPRVSPVVPPRAQSPPLRYTPEDVEEDEDVQEEVEEDSDVDSLADEEEMLQERKQYQRFSNISKALNECIIQTLLRV